MQKVRACPFLSITPHLSRVGTAPPPGSGESGNYQENVINGDNQLGIIRSKVPLFPSTSWLWVSFCRTHLEMGLGSADPWARRCGQASGLHRPLGPSLLWGGQGGASEAARRSEVLGAGLEVLPQGPSAEPLSSSRGRAVGARQGPFCSLGATGKLFGFSYSSSP